MATSWPRRFERDRAEAKRVYDKLLVPLTREFERLCERLDERG